MGRQNIERLHSYARDAGRDPKEIGIEPRISVSQGDPDSWASELSAWKELGATHLSVNTMGAGLKTPQDHIEAIRRFKEAIGAG